MSPPAPAPAGPAGRAREAVPCRGSAEPPLDGREAAGGTGWDGTGWDGTGRAPLAGTSSRSEVHLVEAAGNVQIFV